MEPRMVKLPALAAAGVFQEREMADNDIGRLAVLWRGDREARRSATPQNNRFHRVFEELAALGIHAEPAIYDEDFANEVRDQLMKVDGVLVWVDPLHEGKTRTVLGIPPAATAWRRAARLLK